MPMDLCCARLLEIALPISWAHLIEFGRILKASSIQPLRMIERAKGTSRSAERVERLSDSKYDPANVEGLCTLSEINDLWIVPI